MLVLDMSRFAEKPPPALPAPPAALPPPPRRWGSAVKRPGTSKKAMTTVNFMAGSSFLVGSSGKLDSYCVSRRSESEQVTVDAGSGIPLQRGNVLRLRRLRLGRDDKLAR